ncbi:hypothetical protein KSP40_PGU001927 [Platanthera guangdongensis]|uniref:Uncharacterized protein n=1 Tax=Platanthera guangdongensis TaxID=2320717 RepID=A0ABR2LWK2_9ASPA
MNPSSGRVVRRVYSTNSTRRIVLDELTHICFSFCVLVLLFGEQPAIAICWRLAAVVWWLPSAVKDQAGHHDLSITDLKTNYITSYNKLGDENFTEGIMEFELMQTDKENVELTVNSSNHSDADIKDDHMLLIESNCIKSLCGDEFTGIEDLSPEVSAIYLAMQQSKLECINEKCQDSICENVCVEPEDDFDDFDPYLFIKDLPDLSIVVPKYRSMILPKQTRSCPSTTLVLDLDGILQPMI